jgi:hypothetical protein
MIGTIHSKGTFFLVIFVGDAKAKIEQENTLQENEYELKENKYEMSINGKGYNPIIQSKQTGKFWSITWEELLDLAINAGIDDKEHEEKRNE